MMETWTSSAGQDLGVCVVILDLVQHLFGDLRSDVGMLKRVQQDKFGW